MNKPEKPQIEIKDYQEATSFDLFMEILELGKSALSTYGERELANFIFDLAWHYKTRLFEITQRTQRLALLKALQESTITNSEEAEDIPEEDLQDAFKNKKVH